MVNRGRISVRVGSGIVRVRVGRVRVDRVGAGWVKVGRRRVREG